jgi:[NiFe] hydrogenase assembly HybE family chaperone
MMTGSVEPGVSREADASGRAAGAGVGAGTGTRDPSERLTAAFRAAAARMQGLPIVNPALEVEAVGFAPWNGRWLGVMVTPWFMNLTLVPADPAAWRPLASGAKRRYRFPAGDYEFVGAQDAAIGEYQVCSLFSPMQDFADHATARLVAQLARDALFDPANAEAHVAPAPDLSPSPVEAPAGPLARLETELAAPMSKRDFVRGRFLGGDRDDRG